MPILAPGIRGQVGHLDDPLTFDGTITTGGTAQLLLPQQPRRFAFLVVNSSAADTLHLGLGPATATAALTSGAVTSTSITNAGIGYTTPPQVRVIGGLVAGDYQQTPSRPAVITATISGGAVSALTINDPGAGYVVAPTLLLENPLPQLGGGAWVPTSTTGIALPPGWSFTTNGMIIVPTSAMAIIGPTNGDPFVCKVWLA